MSRIRLTDGGTVQVIRTYHGAILNVNGFEQFLSTGELRDLAGDLMNASASDWDFRTALTEAMLPVRRVGEHPHTDL
jgi:hypothetical protein